MTIAQQEVIVQEQPKIKTLFLFKSIPFLLGIGSFFLAWLLFGRFDWSIPFTYRDGDFFLAADFIKRLIDGAWYFNTSRVGFPFGSNFLDYPASDAGNFAVLKILAVLTHNFALVVNLYIILGFSVIAIASYWVLQQLRLSKMLSVVGAILYAFAPFHFLRLDHLFLACYFSVPLYTYFAFRIFLEKPLFLNKKYVQTVFLIISLLMLSCFGVYYAFFATLSFVGSGIVGSLKWRSSQNICSALIAVVVITTGVGLNIAPNVNFWIKNGLNQKVPVRHPFEAELYGLKMTQMLLPHEKHRSHRLASILQQYEATPFLINENSTASLGAIGTMGLLALLIIFFISPFVNLQIDNRIQLFSFLTVFLFFFATIGGFSSIFTTFITPMIRAWNRISIFINFFSIAGFLILIEILLKKISNLKYFTGNLAVIALLLSVFGVLEQSLVKDKDASKIINKQYISDKHFVEKIEANIPGGAVYQLPYMPFPEVMPINNLASYALFRGYLHSSSLHWSYGCMSGRKGDLFFSNLAVQPLSNQIRAIKPLGFNGVYVDRRGYVDRGKVVETELRKVLSVEPLVSEDKNLVFFPMVSQKK
jgi:phosphoglycerol transferase